MKMISVIFILLLLAVVGSAQAEIYRWTDDQGVINFTDDYAQVPPRYRSRVVIESDTPNISIMPAEEPPEMETAGDGDEATGEENWIPPKVGAPEVIWVIRPFFAPADIRHRHRQREPQLVIPKTPARNAQDSIEEQLRKNRRSLDDSQLPVRRNLEQNEEQIRKTRDGISGH